MSRIFLSVVLGLILSFPIIFQSIHAFEHHILVDNINCCSHHDDVQNKDFSNNYVFDNEVELCPILEYQIVYFLNDIPVLTEHNFLFIHDLKTPILAYHLIKYRDYKEPLRGPPLV